MTQAITKYSGTEPPATSTVVSTPEQDLMRASQGLPHLFVDLLERRYLHELEPNQWRIQARTHDNAPQLLRAVRALGKQRHKEEWSTAMPHVLSACHEPGNSLTMCVFNDGARPNIYLGARRVIGEGGRNSEDFLKAQEGAFRAYFGGLVLDEEASALDAQEMPELSEFLRVAPAFAAVTGIPSRRKAVAGLPFELQSIDQLLKAAGSGRYALVVAAEPIRPEVIDATIDVCRRLIGFVHAFAAVTKSHGSTQGTSKEEIAADTTKRNSHAAKVEAGVAILQVVLGFVGRTAFGGLVDPIQLFGGITLFSRSLESMQARNNQNAQPRSTTSQGSSDQISATFLDANAEACEKLLRDYVHRLEAAHSMGWWKTAVYIAAENDSVLANVAGALRSLCAGETTSLDPIRIHPLPEHLLREAVIKGQVLEFRPAVGNQGHPFGESFDSLATCLTSEELAVLVNLPRTEVPGIPMRDLSEFHLSTESLRVQTDPQRSIEIGTLTDSMGRSLSPVKITENTLNRHLMVTGIPGSGKTNTCWQLLRQSWTELRVPFLVIEPAKAEYFRLAEFPEFKDSLRVYSVGGHTGTPLRLNPFDWVEGVPLLRHITLLKAILTASLFPPGQDSPLPFLMEDALWEIYVEKGWDLHASTNPHLGQGGIQIRSALLPDLGDFEAKLLEIVDRRGYDPTIRGNLQAYLTTRLRSLKSGIKGLTLNSRRSTPFKRLFESPCIIELKEVGDEDEKAFLMALIFSLLYEYAETRVTRLAEPHHERLQHLTLIEEAHRLLKPAAGGSNKLSADPAQKAVTMFTDMLAEMRAYGEGFVIVDQIPTKLASETLKNTNLKIVHRLAAADDRRAVGECMNLDEWQMRHLNNLQPGMAVMHFEDIGEPILCRVPNIKDYAMKPANSAPIPKSTGADEPGRQINSDAIFLHRHRGCEYCTSPCDYFHDIDTASEAFSPVPRIVQKAGSSPTKGADAIAQKQPVGLMSVLGTAMMPVLANLLGNRRDDALEAFRNWCAFARRKIRAANLPGDEENRPVLYCAAAQAIHYQFGELMRNRGIAVQDSAVILSADLVRLERAAAAMARLISVLLGEPDRELSASDVFDWTRTEMMAAIFTEPPQEFRDNSQCPACPSRCTMLPFVAGAARELVRKLASAVTANQTDQGRVLRAAEIIANAHKGLPENQGQSVQAIDPEWIAWNYCVGANLHYLKDEGALGLDPFQEDAVFQILSPQR